MLPPAPMLPPRSASPPSRRCLPRSRAGGGKLEARAVLAPAPSLCPPEKSWRGGGVLSPRRDSARAAGTPSTTGLAGFGAGGCGAKGGSGGSPAAASCASSCLTLALRVSTSAGALPARPPSGSRAPSKVLSTPCAALGVSQALLKLPVSEAEAGEARVCNPPAWSALASLAPPAGAEPSRRSGGGEAC